MKGLAAFARTVIVAGLIAGAAMLIPAAIMLFSTTPQPAAVVFARMPDPAALPEGTSILSWSDRVARLEGVDAATARRLYAAGALLVTPIRQSGCIALRKT